MRSTAMAFLCIILMVWCQPVLAEASVSMNAVKIAEVQETTPAAEGEVKGQAYRSGRGTFSGVRSPGRSGTNVPGRTPANITNNPRTTTPNTPNYGTPARRGWGGIFGGFAAGALLGSLFNPFGFMGYGPGAGSPFSFIGLLFWAAIIYFAYRFFTRSKRKPS